VDKQQRPKRVRSRRPTLARAEEEGAKEESKGADVISDAKSEPVESKDTDVSTEAKVEPAESKSKEQAETASAEPAKAVEVASEEGEPQADKEVT
jgi:hypothetical protein